MIHSIMRILQSSTN